LLEAQLPHPCLKMVVPLNLCFLKLLEAALATPMDLNQILQIANVLNTHDQLWKLCIEKIFDISAFFVALDKFTKSVAKCAPLYNSTEFSSMERIMSDCVESFGLSNIHNVMQKWRSLNSFKSESLWSLFESLSNLSATFQLDLGLKEGKMYPGFS
jgi:hypothetical protein